MYFFCKIVEIGKVTWLVGLSTESGNFISLKAGQRYNVVLNENTSREDGIGLVGRLDWGKNSNSVGRHCLCMS